MKSRLTRRSFLSRAVAGGAGLLAMSDRRIAMGTEANSRLGVALVGVGGRGRWFVDTIPRMERVVAICDVDERKVAEATRRWGELAERFAASEHSWERDAAPEYRRLAGRQVSRFSDFRRMLDTMDREIDAVVIAIPDHTHAVASAAALHAGKPVFCEKPLTRTVHEARALRDLAQEQQVATSMGNQGTASGPFRRALELIREGAIGEVKEVHVWNTGGGADRKSPPRGKAVVPEGFDWNLWLGPAAERPYHPDWIRRHLWREFGTCQLGNWATHSANLAFMALRVHELWSTERRPESGARIRFHAKSSGINQLSFPRWEVVRWEVPARRDLPPVPFTWHNGPAAGSRDLLASLVLDEQDPDHEKEWHLDHAGTVIVGARGRIHATGHNATFRLLPQKDFEGVDRERPTTVDRSRGHEMDWFTACRGGKPAWASFEYAAPLTEFLMLGNVATRFGDVLEFDPAACRIVNNAEADALLRPAYREGWFL